MRSIREFWNEEDGVGVVEVILILVVLIGLVIIFKKQLTTLVNSIFETITKNVKKSDEAKQRRKYYYFSALCLMLVASLLLALLESARVYGLDARAGLLTELGVESVCGEYQIKLWQDYGLLCLDGAYSGEKFQAERVAERFVEQVSKTVRERSMERIFYTFGIRCRDVFLAVVDGWRRTCVFALVSSYMKQNLPKEAAKAILERYESGQKLEEEKDSYSVEDAKGTLEDAKEEAEANAEGNGKQTQAVCRKKKIRWKLC